MSSQSFIIGVIAEADNSSDYPATGSYVIYVCKLLNCACKTLNVYFDNFAVIVDIINCLWSWDM